MLVSPIAAVGNSEINTKGANIIRERGRYVWRQIED